MKTLKHIELKTDNGEVIKDASLGKELNTANLISIALGQTQYKTTDEQWRAYDVNKKLESGKDVSLEDTEYELVKKVVDDFTPYKNGFVFMPFLELFK